MTEAESPRRCPRCKNNFELETIHGVEVDRCACSIWLDRGELGALVSAPPEQVVEMVGRGDSAQVPPLHAGIKHPCPACTGTLKTIQLPNQRIDQCEQCRGVLVGRDDLETVLKDIQAQWEAKKG